MSKTETQKAIQEFFQNFDIMLKKLNPDSSREDALEIIQEIQQYYNSNINVLMDYDKSQVQRQIDEKRKQYIEDKRENKKFTFRSKRTMKTETNLTHLQNTLANSHDSNTQKEYGNEFDQYVKHDAIKITNIHDNPSFEYNYNSKGDDFLIENCSNSKLNILSVSGACFLRDLSNCTIFMSPVNSSIMLHNCKKCKFYLISQQIRIHHCHDSEFYLIVASDPIIEHSSQLSFGEYKVEHPVVSSQIGEDILNKPNKFANVKDFGWLQSNQSPNWKLI